MQVSYRQRLLIGFLLAVVLMGTWYFYIFRNQNQKITATTGEISRIRTQIAQGNSSINQLPEIQKEVLRMDAEFDTLLITIPTKEEIAFITNTILDISKQNNLEILQIQPSLDAILTSTDYFVKVPIDIMVKGSFLQTGQFVEDVRKVPFQFYITDISFEKLTRQTELEIEINSYIYVINSSGEI